MHETDHKVFKILKKVLSSDQGPTHTDATIVLISVTFEYAFYDSMYLQYIPSLSLSFSGMAVLSLSLQHFIAGLITTLTFTVMMNCTQRADENIQVSPPTLLPLITPNRPARQARANCEQHYTRSLEVNRLTNLFSH